MAWAAVIHRSVAHQLDSRAAPAQATAAHRAQLQRIGQQVILGAIAPPAAGQAYADLADTRLRSAATAVFGDLGLMHEAVAVVALGPLGARDMTAVSPLDIAVVFDGARPDLRHRFGRAASALADALSGSPQEGDLYGVRLHRGGAAEDLEPRLHAAGPAQLMPLTRARVAWTTSPALGARIKTNIAHTLRQPRSRAACVRGVQAHRRRFPAWASAWDCQDVPGGLTDIALAAQLLQVAHGRQGAPLIAQTTQALAALHHETFLGDGAYTALSAAFVLQQRVLQAMAAVLPAEADPQAQSGPVQALLACACGAPDLDSLKASLIEARRAAAGACLDLQRA
jgi:glutamate-ammonia-ligase adenylyltransferase